MSDRGSGDVPLKLNDTGCATTKAALAFGVRHAQDVELDGLDLDARVPLAEVAIEVMAGPPIGPVTYEHVLPIESGTLSIGDADHEDLIPVASEKCRISVKLDDRHHAEHVRVWISPVADT